MSFLAFRNLLLCCALFVACAGRAQGGLTTPTNHYDTLLLVKWTGPIKKNQRDGEWTATDRLFGGKTTANYSKGKLNGEWRVADKSGGRVEEGNYADNKRDGRWIKYDALGDTLLLCHYKKGVLDGPYRTFTTRNHITRKGNFVDGKRDGEWILMEYSPELKLVRKQVYQYTAGKFEWTMVSHEYSGTSRYSFEKGRIVLQQRDSIVDSTYLNMPPEKKQEVLMFAEEMPDFPGGSGAFNEYLARNIRYPSTAREAGLQGIAYVSFRVQADGSITNVEVIKGVPGAPELDEEAKRVITEMPAWTPGKMNGRPVIIQMIMPVRFTLQ